LGPSAGVTNQPVGHIVTTSTSEKAEWQPDRVAVALGIAAAERALGALADDGHRRHVAARLAERRIAPPRRQSASSTSFPIAPCFLG
jgi:hypothetical protein